MTSDAPENMAPALPPHAPRLRLSVATADGQAACDVETPIVLVGSRRDCHLPVSHPDLSKVHCAVINTGRAVLVCDLLSRSGTFVNNEAVRLSLLRPGDVLRAGPVEITAEFSDGAAADAPASLADLVLPEPIVLEVGDQRLEVRQAAAVIGRRQGADLIIDTPDTSLAHALLLTVDGRPVLGDLGSRSGTLVNGERIELSWLGDGDAVDIGGQPVTVRWAGAEQTTAEAEQPAAVEQATAEAELAEAEAEAAAPTPPVAETVPPVLPVGEEWGDLERTIQTVQAQIAAAREQLEQRSADLDARQADLDQRQAALGPQRAALAESLKDVQRREATLQESEQAIQAKLAEAEGQAATLAVAREELAGQQAAFEAQRGELETQRGELDATRAELTAAQTQVEKQQQELAAAQAAAGERERELQAQAEELAGADAALAEQRAQLEAEQATLAQRQGELDERDAALAVQAEELAAREASLQDRESREGEAFQRIEQFRSALHRASEVFATVAGPKRAPAVPDGAPAGRAAPGPAPEANEEMVEAADGQPAEEDADDGLPAPMVDEPLFNAGATGAPTDWPPELRERYRVLRRMSKKSNEELLAQVWAERGRTMRSREAAPEKGQKKKSRFSWGN
ncbi:MAG: FHA domain-containing protein [Phycisphaerae bacterium]|jgi:pSer/pThr/pTyr-binding forkhead associated (FHA) protein